MKKTHSAWRFILAAFWAVLAMVFIGAGSTHAAPPKFCAPTTFSLSGSVADQFWNNVTPNQWAKMLSANWQDNGFHFYGRVRQRGPDAGINTPSDLESEIRKGTPKPEGTPNRWQINLPILSSGGQPLRVIYDYDGSKNAKCSLVTLSY
ncbi:hypothetical protein [Thalassospira lucentensis]|uniref:hypothetical protein n=1 Tax=Thalassospira lucentensis TaxID=168935 RepID=UPI00399D6FAD